MKIRIKIEELEKILKGQNLDVEQYSKVRRLKLTGISVWYNGNESDELELTFT